MKQETKKMTINGKTGRSPADWLRRYYMAKECLCPDEIVGAGERDIIDGIGKDKLIAAFTDSKKGIKNLSIITETDVIFDANDAIEMSQYIQNTIKK